MALTITTVRNSVYGIFIACLLLFGQRGAIVAAPPLILEDVNGMKVQPLAPKGNAATVFFFLSHDCPISNGYAPEMNRICAEYGAKKVAFYMVYTDINLPATEQKEHAKSFGYTSPALRDPKHRLVERVGVTITPEVAVLAPDGRLLYRGRIDNTYARLGVRRYQTTEHDLRDALDAILARKAVPHPRTTAVGCFITAVK